MHNRGSAVCFMPLVVFILLLAGEIAMILRLRSEHDYTADLAVSMFAMVFVVLELAVCAWGFSLARRSGLRNWPAVYLTCAAAALMLGAIANFGAFAVTV